MKVEDADKSVVDFPHNPYYRVAVLGLGGAAGRVVDRLAGCRMRDTRMCVFGMNSQEIDDVSFAEKYLIGDDGLGSGKDNLTAMYASLKLLPVVNKIISVPVMVVYVVCLGGATGESCAKIFLKETKRNTYAGKMLIAALPHHLEGKDKRERAKKRIKELKPFVDGVMVVDYENIDATSVSSLYKRADDMLVDMARAFVRLLTVNSILDFGISDVDCLMRLAKDKIIDFVTLTGDMDYIKDRLKHFDKLLPARYVSIADVSGIVCEICYPSIKTFERFGNISNILRVVLYDKVTNGDCESYKFKNAEMVKLSMSIDEDMKNDDIRVNIFLACRYW